MSYFFKQAENNYYLSQSSHVFAIGYCTKLKGWMSSELGSDMTFVCKISWDYDPDPINILLKIFKFAAKYSGVKHREKLAVIRFTGSAKDRCKKQRVFRMAVKRDIFTSVSCTLLLRYLRNLPKSWHNNVTAKDGTGIVKRTIWKCSLKFIKRTLNQIKV